MRGLMEGNRMTERINGYCLLVLSSIFISCRWSSAQPGFISIDCGSDANYKDPFTNISWVPDAGFISTGYNVASLNVSRVLHNENKQQMRSVRYFNGSRTKHCYVLPVHSNQTFLVRATFMYGNYDQKRVFPTFDLAIDTTFWTTIDLAADGDRPESWYRPKTVEILVPSSGSTLFVCIIRKSLTDNPFISSLELRPITDGAYSFVREKNVILHTVRRVNCGELYTALVRYPEDKFDRFWVAQEQPGDQVQGTSIFTTHALPPQSMRLDQPPSLVLQSAWSAPVGFSFRWNLSSNITKFYAALYFAEIDRPRRVDTRIISINFNNEPWGEPLYLTSYGDLVMVERFGELTARKTANFSLFRAAGSTLDPLINALEFFAILGTPNGATLQEDVDALLVLRTQFNLDSWTGDPCLPIPWDWLSCSSSVPPRVTTINLSGTNISGAVPVAITQLGALTDLWLDNNSLTAIPDDFTLLTNLQTLHLQNNRLVGDIPISLTRLHQLRELFLENNLFDGKFPEALKNSSGFIIRAYGSPYLCMPDGTNCGGDDTSKMGAIIGSVLGVVAAFIILGVIIYYFRFRKFPVLDAGTRLSGSSFDGSAYEMYSSHGNSPPLVTQGDRPLKIQARNLSADDVKSATRSFKIKIGEGRHGPVYYGQLSPDGQEVAVKLGYTASQGKDQFLNDVALLSRIRHKNLVCLVGYCDDVGQEMLIFEFMPKGTLRDHLYGNIAKLEPLNWQSRLDVALNAARGLEYLHTHCSPRMIHGDVTSSNILLNGRMVAQVADFGLSKFTSDDGLHTPHMMNGSMGYVDPEYYNGQTVTPKSDVFNFGVVLLEMICGRDPIRCPDQMHIIPWVKLSLQDGNIHAVVDPSLRGKYNVEAIWHVAELALLSTEMQAVNRPTMSQVLRGIAEAIEIESGSPVAIPVSGDLGLISVGYISGSSRRA